jgi:hypothetical protein
VLIENGAYSNNGGTMEEQWRNPMPENRTWNIDKGRKMEKRRKRQAGWTGWDGDKTSPPDKTPPPAPPHRGGEAMRWKEQSINNVYSAWLPSPVERGRGRGLDREGSEEKTKKMNNEK